MSAMPCPVCHGSGELTARRPLKRSQARVYRAIVAHFKMHQVSPTLRELADALGWRAQSSVSEHVKALIDKGYVVRRHNEPKTIELVHPIVEEVCK